MLAESNQRLSLGSPSYLVGSFFVRLLPAPIFGAQKLGRTELECALSALLFCLNPRSGSTAKETYIKRVSHPLDILSQPTIRLNCQGNSVPTRHALQAR